MSEFYSNFIRLLTQWQYKLNTLVSGNLRGLESDAVWGTVTILGIAFLYGVIHAAGPGHGKALVGFYFLKQGGSFKKAFKMGYLIALVHATSALLLFLAWRYPGRRTLDRSEATRATDTG